MPSSDNSPIPHPLASWLSAARDAAAAAADFITQQAATRSTLHWQEKSAQDFVSAVDVGAEERIRALLLSRIPDLRIIGEELGADGAATDGLVAIVDPLDGTTNFLHGYPAYGVSIAIAVHGVLQVGVVHDVARGGVYWAAAGHGAWHDGAHGTQRLAVSPLTVPARALIGTGIPFKDRTHMAPYLEQLGRLMPAVAGVRRAGSAALDLCDVAAGRFAAFWELRLAPWDFAAGMLLVREAGGQVTDLSGHDAPLDHGPIVAGGALHPWLLATVTETPAT
jgi:myo-inositol-1(or 4)-monophosphatase